MATPKSKPRPTRSRHFSPAHTATHPTLQSPSHDANINNIVGRWLTTGNPPEHINLHTPKWGDFSTAGTYHDMANRVASVAQSFARLPSKIRRKFENQPEQLMDYLSDPANYPEAIELGILDPSLQPPNDPAPDSDSGPPAADDNFQLDNDEILRQNSEPTEAESN